MPWSQFLSEVGGFLKQLFRERPDLAHTVDNKLTEVCGATCNQLLRPVEENLNDLLQTSTEAVQRASHQFGSVWDVNGDGAAQIGELLQLLIDETFPPTEPLGDLLAPFISKGSLSVTEVVALASKTLLKQGDMGQQAIDSIKEHFTGGEV